MAGEKTARELGLTRPCCRARRFGARLVRGCDGRNLFSPIGRNMFHVEQNVSIQIVALLLRGDSHHRKLAKELGISHTTVLRKLKGLLDGNVVDFRIEGKNRVYFLKKPLRRGCTPIWLSGTRSET